jgi:HEPN domain-containing protein
MSGLDDLIAKRFIEPVEVDELTARQWIEDARRHLQAAQAVETIDPAGAYVLAYDAARKSVAAVLLMTGHRVTSRPGSHQALALFAKTLAEDADEPALAQLDRLRRNRNRSEYGSRTFGAAEVKEAIQNASATVDASSKRI